MTHETIEPESVPFDRTMRDRQCFYLIDENQSAELEGFRFAMQGIAGIAWDCVNGEAGHTMLDRRYLGSLFDQFEKRLGDIIGRPESIWLDRDVQAQKAD